MIFGECFYFYFMNFFFGISKFKKRNESEMWRSLTWHQKFTKTSVEWHIPPGSTSLITSVTINL